MNSKKNKLKLFWGVVMKDFKKIRISKKLTQQEVADKANISLRQLVRIEHNKCIAQLETQILLLKALNVRESEIIEYVIKEYIQNNDNYKGENNDI